jgi:dephospho-CoA kinase
VNPVLVVVAGPNGAGKTTVTVRLREEHWSEGVEYLNPDDVARDRFGDWNYTCAGNRDMSELGATITIRLSPEELRRLRARARAAKTTPSAIVRELLERDLGELDDDGPTLGELSRPWIGAISRVRLPRGRDARQALARWKPDTILPT